MPGALEWHVNLNLHLVMRCHRPQNWGLIIFKTPYLPLQASLEKMLSSSWGSCPSAESRLLPLLGEEVGVQAALGGRDETVHRPFGHWIGPIFTGSTVWSITMRTQNGTESEKPGGRGVSLPKVSCLL